MYIHVTLVPFLETSGELKSKPTQHSVKELLSLGIRCDVLVCRTAHRLSKDLIDKLALFCNVSSDCVIENTNAYSLYDVPLMLEKRGLAKAVIKRLGLEDREPDLDDWKTIVEKQKTLDGSVKIALVGKYVELHDAYISIVESLTHAGIAHGVNVEIDWIDFCEVTEENYEDKLKDADGILVPGGFGSRGIDGKILAVKYARENKVPYLGICLGMQLAVIEFARNVAGLAGAHSAELDPNTPYPVIDLMPDQKNIENMGGTMRLGKYLCKLIDGTNAKRAYGEDEISERHRHRYEFNNDYKDILTKAG